MDSRDAATERPFVPADHSNYPRMGWTIFGMTIGVVLTATSWATGLGVLLGYSLLWLLWTVYLLGRKYGS